MKSFLTITALAASLFFTCIATAAHDHGADKSAKSTPGGKLVAVTEKDAAWAAKARATYPAQMCMISDEKLGGEMGKPQEYIYREEGKTDRLIMFCCNNCVDDFNKEPAKYLSKLDASAKGKPAGDKKADQGHDNHHK